MATNRISIIIDLQGEGFRKGADQINRSLDGIEKNAQRSMRGASKSVDSLSVSIKQMGSEFGNLQRVIFSGAAATGVAWPLKLSADMERARVSLTTLMGGMSEANRILADLKTLSLSQPFEFFELKDTVTMLTAFKFRSGEVLGVLKDIADAAAGLGGTSEKLNNIALAIGQIKVKGRLNAEEINKQLGEAGVPASRYLATALSKETGKLVTPGEVMKLAEKQRLDAEVGLKAILEGMRRDFGGLGARIAETTLSGQFQKLIDSAKFAGAAIGDAFNDRAKGAVAFLRGLTNDVKGAAESFSRLPGPIRDVAAALTVLAVAAPVLPSIVKLLAFIPKNIGLVSSAVTGAASMATLTNFKVVMGTSFIGPLTEAQSVARGVISVMGRLSLAILAVQAAWQGVTLFRELSDLTAFRNAIEHISTAMKDFIVSALDIPKRMIDSMLDSLEGVLDRLERIAEKRGLDVSGVRSTAGNIGWGMGKVKDFMLSSPLSSVAEWAGMAFPERESMKTSALARARRNSLNMALPSRADEDIARANERNRSLLKTNEDEVNAFAARANEKFAQASKEGATGRFRVGPEYVPLINEGKRIGGPGLATMYAAAAMEAEREKRKFQDAWLATGKKLAEDVEDAERKRMEMITERWQKEQEFSRETADMEISSLRSQLQYEENILSRRRDYQTRGLDAEQAVTIAQKIGVEEKKLAIDLEYMEKAFAHKKRMLILERDAEIQLMRATAEARGIDRVEIDRRETAILNRYIEQSGQLAKDTSDAIVAARQDATVRSVQIVRDQNMRVFESLKDQAGGVFDALLTKSNSVWAAIGNSFKSIILTAIKDVVTSRIAAMLMRMMGVNVSLVRGAGTGPGGEPVFGGGGGSAAGSAAGILGMLAGAPAFGAGFGVPGLAVLPGFMGAGAAGAGSANSRLGSMASSAMYVPGGIGLLSAGKSGGLLGPGAAMNLGALGLGGAALGMFGAFKAGQSDNPILKGMAPAIGAVSGLLGFGALSMLFPSLIAAGPAGWIAAAGIGAAIGIAALLKKSPEKKAREKIKARYGVDISDRGVLQQIIQMAKASYGGNLDMALGAEPVRQLIELYAQMTGQRMALSSSTPRAVPLIETGGQVYQSPTYVNGKSYAFDGGFPVIGGGSLDSVPAGYAANAVINLSIDSTTVGQAVLQNGQLVTSGAIKAMNASAGRREFAVAALQPGLVLG